MQYQYVSNEDVIAECISASPLILQSKFSISRMWPTSVLLTNAIKSVACVQTSFPFRNAIKRTCLLKVVYTYVSLSFLVL